MTHLWTPYEEPIRTTLSRTVAIAAVAAGVFCLVRGRWGAWLAVFVAAMWPSFGGHWLEIFFLNWLRPRVGGGPGALAAARLVTWFAGGLAFAFAMRFTAGLFGVNLPVPLLLGGVAFVGIELLAHLGLQGRGRPNFYNGLG